MSFIFYDFKTWKSPFKSITHVCRPFVHDPFRCSQMKKTRASAGFLVMPSDPTLIEFNMINYRVVKGGVQGEGFP